MLHMYVHLYAILLCFNYQHRPSLVQPRSQNEISRQNISRPTKQNIGGAIHPYLSSSAPATGLPIRRPTPPNAKLILRGGEISGVTPCEGRLERECKARRKASCKRLRGGSDPTPTNQPSNSKPLFSRAWEFAPVAFVIVQRLRLYH
jgi:hypothetical protein